MLPKLTAIEARIIGCLMEKSVTTPDVYPLTLNSLTHACNQKSSRDPAMSLTPGEVQRAARDLHDKHLVRIVENFKNGVEKYTQRFCNGRLDEFQFDPAQFAIICLLLLRGPQTPGELRAHSGRLHTFPHNEAVVVTLTGLIEREGLPLVVKLPRTPGRKDSEYMHLFCGPIENVAEVKQPPVTETSEQAAVTTSCEQSPIPSPGGQPSKINVSDLADRVSRLEAELAELKELLQTVSP